MRFGKLSVSAAALAAAFIFAPPSFNNAAQAATHQSQGNATIFTSGVLHEATVLPDIVRTTATQQAILSTAGNVENAALPNSGLINTSKNASYVDVGVVVSKKTSSVSPERGFDRILWRGQEIQNWPYI